MLEIVSRGIIVKTNRFSWVLLCAVSLGLLSAPTLSFAAKPIRFCLNDKTWPRAQNFAGSGYKCKLSSGAICSGGSYWGLGDLGLEVSGWIRLGSFLWPERLLLERAAGLRSHSARQRQDVPLPCAPE